jgi:hypothetical protein
LGLGFLMLVSLVLSAALAAFGKWWGGLFGGWEILASLVNFVISFGVVTAVIAAIYKFMPRAAIAWHDVWIGAAVTALLFTVGKFVIGQCLGRTGVASGFGAAGSLVVLLVWVYYSAQIFLLGAEFTWVYANHHGSRASDTAPSPAALPQRSARPAVEPPPPPASTPLASPVPPRAPRDISYAFTPHDEAGVLRPAAFIEQHPIKGLGIVVALGFLIGGVLRHVAPSENVFHRERRVSPRFIELPQPTPPVRVAARKKSSFIGGLLGTWKTKARRSLLRELLMAGTAQLLATRFGRRPLAARQGSWIRRLTQG